jgi:hypothetical protein
VIDERVPRLPVPGAVVGGVGRLDFEAGLAVGERPGVEWVSSQSGLWESIGCSPAALPMHRVDVVALSGHSILRRENNPDAGEVLGASLECPVQIVEAKLVLAAKLPAAG